jgi:hypothetical protein
MNQFRRHKKVEIGFGRPITLLRLGVGLLVSGWQISSSVSATTTVNDGSQVTLAPGTYSNLLTYRTATQNNNATGTLNFASETVTFASKIPNFYGPIVLQDGNTTNLTTTSASTQSRWLLGGASYTTPTKLIKKNTAFSITGYNASNQTLVIGPYGILDLSNTSNSGNLTLSQSLFISNYKNANVGYIQFKPQGTTRQIVSTNGTILTDDPTSGQIDITKHLVYDFSEVTSIKVGSLYTYTLATLKTNPVLTGSLTNASANILNNTVGFDAFIVSTTPSGGNYLLQIEASKQAQLQVDNGATLQLAPGIYPSSYSIYRSSSQQNSSNTGIVQVLGGNTTLGANFVNFDGSLQFLSGSNVNWTSSTSTNANLILAGATVTKQNGAFSISETANTTTPTTPEIRRSSSLDLGNTSSDTANTTTTTTLEIRPSSALDLSHTSNTGDLTLAHNLYFTTYASNASTIQYSLTSGTLYKIIATNGTITTDGCGNKLDISKSLQFNFSGYTANVTNFPTVPSTKTFVLANLKTSPSLTGSISNSSNLVTNNDTMWNTFGVTSISNSGTYNLTLSAQFNPAWLLVDAVTYKGTFESMNATVANDMAVSTDQKLLKNLTLGQAVSPAYSLNINLQTFTLSGSSANEIVIASGKTLAFKAGSGGVFNGTVKFSATTSTLGVLTDGVLGTTGNGFGIDASGTTGYLAFGDGTTGGNFTYTNGDSRFTKITKLKVNAGVTLQVIQN